MTSSFLVEKISARGKWKYEKYFLIFEFILLLISGNVVGENTKRESNPFGANTATTTQKRSTSSDIGLGNDQEGAGLEPVSVYRTAYACQGDLLKITCQDDFFLDIVRANYGRFSVAICNEEGRTDLSVNCLSPNSLEVLQRR